MKHATYDKEIVINGLALPINTTKTSGCYVEILHALHDQMRAMLSYHCRLLVVGFDLHLHDDTPDNLVMTRCMDKLKVRIRQHYKSATAMGEIGYLWVREQKKASAPHFHVVVLLDAKHIKSAHPIHELITSIWEGWGHPRPYRASNRTFRIKRNDEETFGEAFRALSYYAKEATKGRRAKATNDYSTSRLKQKQGNQDMQGV